MINCLILVSDLRPKLIFDSFYIGVEYLPENNDKYMYVCFLLTSEVKVRKWLLLL